MINKNLVVDSIWLRMWWLSEHYRKNQCVFVGRSPITRMFPARWLLTMNKSGKWWDTVGIRVRGAGASIRVLVTESLTLMISCDISQAGDNYLPVYSGELRSASFLFAAVWATLILWAAGGRKAGLDPCTHVQSVHLYSERRGRPLMSAPGAGHWSLVTVQLWPGPDDQWPGSGSRRPVTSRVRPTGRPVGAHTRPELHREWEMRRVSSPA